MKNTITETKNILEGMNSRLDGTEDWTSNLEGKVAENTQLEQQEGRRIQQLQQQHDK